MTHAETQTKPTSRLDIVRGPSKEELKTAQEADFYSVPNLIFILEDDTEIVCKPTIMSSTKEGWAIVGTHIDGSNQGLSLDIRYYPDSENKGTLRFF
ncbi:MAG: hypothetical protein ABH837_01350 [bacterium]